MVIAMLFIWLIAVAIIAVGVAMFLRVFLPGFPFYVLFLVAFAGTFLTLFGTAMLLIVFHHPR
jgi:hypothetical protein